MAGSEGKMTKTESKRLRKEAGRHIRLARVKAEMTQKELADKLGLPFYTFVSSVENGQSRVPDQAVQEWAEALGVDTSEFCKMLLAHYHPGFYAGIFNPRKRVKR